MIKRVLQAMKVGEKAIFTTTQLVEALNGDLSNCVSLGFLPLKDKVTLFNKDLGGKQAGYIVYKGPVEGVAGYSWIRNPCKFMKLTSKGEGIILTEGVPNVLAYGKGLVSNCLKAGFKVNRTVKVVVENSSVEVFRAYYLERTYD